MKILELKFTAQANTNKYLLTMVDITQKLAHLSRINNKPPDTVNFADLRQHIVKSLREEATKMYRFFLQEAIVAEIKRIQNNPSKPLPLP